MKKTAQGFVVALVLSAVWVLQAETLVWTGGAGNSEWSDTLNWSPEKKPASGDRVVFNPGQGQSLYVHVTIPGGNVQIGDIEVQSGSVYFSGATIYLYGSSLEHEIRVHEGAKLSVTNEFAAWTADRQHSIHKRGLGVYEMCMHLGLNAKALHVEEGKFNHPIKASGGVFQCDVDIYDGAELYLSGYNAFNSGNRRIVNVHKGGLFRLNGGDGQNYFTAIVGEGEVRADSKSPVYMNLPVDRGPYVFSGVYSTSHVHLILQNSDESEYVIASTNALASIGSIKGISALRFGSQLDAPVKISKVSSSGTLTLCDTNGAPVDVETTMFGSDYRMLNTIGGGDLTLLSSAYFTNSVFASTGKLIAASGSTVYMGNNTEEGDCDFRAVSEISGKGSFIFNNHGSTAFPMPISVAANVEVYGGGGVFSELNLNDATLYFNTNVAIESGRSNFSYNGLHFKNGTPRLVVKGGRHYESSALVSNDKISSLKRPTAFFPANEAGNDASLRIEGGEVFMGCNSTHRGIGLIELAGGKWINSGTYYPSKNATPENPSKVVFDGGELSCSIANVYNVTPFSSTNALEISVGAGGGTISTYGAHYDDYSTLAIKRPVISGVTAPDKDGGLTRLGRGKITFHYPISISGTMAFLDGWNVIGDYADIGNSPAFFGNGDLKLENAVLDFNDVADGKTLKLACGESSQIVYSDSAVIRLGSGNKRHHITAGNADAAENSVFRRQGKGSVLFIDETADAALDGSASTFKVRGGVATNAAGVVSQPIVALYITGSNTHYPFTYDENLGLVRYNSFSSVPSADGSDEFLRLPAESYLTEPQGYSAIGLDISSKHLGFKNGSTLRLGNGIDPALVILNFGSIGGDGTIDFGDSEGIVIASDRGTVSTDVSCKLAGRNGVTFAASPRTFKASVWLNANNTFTGGAYISGVRARIAKPSALGTGKIYVAGAQRNGGCVHIESDGTIANDMSLSGWGSGNGALCFGVDATVSGNVDIRPGTRIRADAGAYGMISGNVSGDRLEVYNSKGTLEISGSCTHTGGTEIVAATLVRSGSDVTLGDGEIVLDGGTLVFDASVQTDIGNDISGIGTIGLKGAAPVTFSGDLSKLDAVLDLLGSHQTFQAMPPFGSITNSLSVKATMEFVSGLGTVQWGNIEIDGKIIVKIGGGTYIDLGGKEITILRKEGDGKFVNGTVNEIRPLGGMTIILR